MANQPNHLVGFPVKLPHFNFILLLGTSNIWFHCTYELLPDSTHISVCWTEEHIIKVSHVVSTDILWSSYYLNFLFTINHIKSWIFFPLKKKKVSILEIGFAIFHCSISILLANLKNCSWQSWRDSSKGGGKIQEGRGLWKSLFQLAAHSRMSF